MIRRFLDPDSVGRPQFLAAGLLLVYLAQCAWLIRAETHRGTLSDSDHALRVYYGFQQWKGGAIAGTPESLRAEAATGMPSGGRLGHLRVRGGYDRDRSPLYYLVAAAPLLVAPPALRPDSALGQLWAATPYLFFGAMLGGSLWYVSRRLYGNSGGYIALGLYCFSPAMIVAVAGPNLGEMGAVWGAFGSIWTAIAVAHTLYAPREVVLWNWRRILLLGFSLALAVGNQFSLVPLALAALLFMLWVAPVRRRAVLAIWAAACAVALVILCASYCFFPALLWLGMTHASWLDFEPRALAMSISYRAALAAIVQGSPPLLLALPVALVVFVAWKRARYFGNAAPLLVAGLMLVLAIASLGFPGAGFHLTAAVFLFVFLAGVFADLLETKSGLLVAAGLCGLLIAGALWNLLQLARLG